MLETLTHEDFRPRVGETFTFATDEGGSRSVELQDVEVLEGPDDGKRAPFSLMFRDSAAQPFPQQTVQVSHPDMGEFPLFVVALGAGDEGARYQAVFT